jgi:hypothetical protein
MATVTPGYTFTNDEVVTPAKLAAAATPTVSNIVTADLVDANVTTAKIADANVTTAKIADGAVTQSKLNSSVTLVPTGAVMPFAMNSAPSGWLEANGNEYSKTGTYSALFAAIGTTFGETNGSGGVGTTHFRVPDLRGIFVRGSGQQTIGGISYNKTFGAKETDAMQGHRHSATTTAVVFAASYPGFVGGGEWVGSAGSVTVGNPTTDTTNGTPRTASETRPANIAMLYCIKA